MKNKQKSSTRLAIDFGTSNSLVGAWHNQQRIDALKIDPRATDPTMMRTLLYFPNGDQCFYGADAIVRFLEHEMEGRLFRSFKSHLPNRSYLGTYVDQRPVTLEHMIGIFLLELRKRSESILNTEIDSAVIGRPARYSLDPESDTFALHRMEKAAEIAGFKNVEFVPEPLAAALEFRRHLQEDKIILIGDFGGGTSDFTILKIGPYEFSKEHVLGLDGCPLAGDSFDSLFMSHRINAYFGATAEYKVSLGSNTLKMPISITEKLNKPALMAHLKERNTYEFIREVRKGAMSDRDKAAIDRLFVLIEDNQIFSVFEEIEKTKRKLSHQDEAEFEFSYPGLEIKSPFNRKKFEEWATPNREKIFTALDECMTQAQLSAQQVDLVYLTGGTAQVPLIQQELTKRFGESKLQTQAMFHSVLSGLVEYAGLEER